MLNKYRYKNKLRYNLNLIEKKNILLSWEKKENITNNTQYKKNKNKKGNIFWKHQNINNIIYKSACNYYNILTNNLWKEKKILQDWSYYSSYSYRKQPFVTGILTRKTFIDNILTCIKNKDSLYYIRNSLYYLLEEKMGVNKVFDVLNFSWLYVAREEAANNDLKEYFNLLALKSFYNGFLKKSNKRKCEVKFSELLSLLKLKLNKASLHIMCFFITKLKPLVGFRRRRLGFRNLKKKEIRYFFKLYGHNLRWQCLLIKRICFNSPYYQKRTQNASVNDIYKGLISSINSKGPIAKCLAMYYMLIGRRTPYAQRQKKKKKRKSKSVRF